MKQTTKWAKSQQQQRQRQEREGKRKRVTKTIEKENYATSIQTMYILFSGHTIFFPVQFIVAALSFISSFFSSSSSSGSPNSTYRGGVVMYTYITKSILSDSILEISDHQWMNEWMNALRYSIAKHLDEWICSHSFFSLSRLLLFLPFSVVACSDNVRVYDMYQVFSFSWDIFNIYFFDRKKIK